MKNQEKIIIFSHESDIDGLGNIILGKAAFGDIDYVLVPNTTILECEFRDYLDRGDLYKYDRIFITDLALYNPSLEIVSKDPILSKKVLVFDHHKSAINEGCNKYSFTTIKEADKDGRKRCGTDLFYEYLCSKKLLLRTMVVDEFVELTRLEDTWEWKKMGSQGFKAHDLAILFNGIGIDGYIEKILLKLSLSDTSFEFDQNEKRVIEQKKEEYLSKLKKLWNEAEIFVDEDGYKFAAIFASYEYRNELAEYIINNSKDIQYLIIIALEKGEYGQKSYRAIQNGFDVLKIAEAHGGKGHPAAAAVEITKEQRDECLIIRKDNLRDSIKYLVESKYEKQ